MYRRRAGVVVEPVGDVWAAFSPVSGETCLLNNECAAVLEVLADGVASTAQVAAQLAQDTGDDSSALLVLIDNAWAVLIDGGLVQKLPPGPITGP